ncbi:MAG: flagellar assembly protein FliW [Candidatus Nitrohelix vancouverensis]|uniref:Flagellar assembly factor FliW n=1 Tax=Candidatus Nitrohelix vancouverensis TaxID=2705534 RepID=A0A7T0C1A0_9BACT|nr:MAG: flagellar assembly protein FliW [Candidatus Nitrohelix vancouverensis]
MQFETVRFGLIEFDEEDVLEFPVGIYGFEREQRFVLVPFDPNIDCPLQWLQSLTTPGLAFVVTDPYAFMPDYRWSLSLEEERQVDKDGADEISVLIIVTVPDAYTDMTGNFLAPLVINPRTRLARQVVLTTVEYDTRHYLLPDEVRAGAKIAAE